jgi:hypothetical protein
MFTSSRFWRRAGVAATCALALLTLALREARSDNIVITLDRGFLERTVEDAVTLGMAAEPALYWGHVSGRRVEVTRQDEDTINVDLDLAYALSHFPNPEVDVDLQIRFNCFWVRPDIDISIPDLDVDVDFPWYIDVGTAGLTWIFDHIADHFIAKKIDHSQAIKQEVLAKVNEAVHVPLTYCPAFNVTADGDVQVILGHGNECTDGQTKHRRCLSGSRGSGYDDLCINGYWETVSSDCEPYCGPNPC